MHEWPSAGERDPASSVKRAVLDAGGVLELTAGELGARFGVQRLTKTARERIAANLSAAGLVAEPAVEQAQRNERLRVTLHARDLAPVPPRPVSPAATPVAAARVAPAAVPGKRRRRRGWLVGVAVALLVLIAVSSGGGEEAPEPRPTLDADVAASPTPTPTPAAAKPDPLVLARRRAKALARGGKYSAALGVLRRAGERSGLARRLRRRGSRALLTRARRELAASHEDRARAYARRARRLGAVAAGAVIRTAEAQAAAERAEARERRRPPAAAPAASPGCDPNYSGECLDPGASDYDCAGGSGDGPEYTGPVEVVGNDHYDLNADPEEDSTGCEAE